MAKKNNDYFEALQKHSSCCVEASNLLEDILCRFRADEIEDYRRRMHDVERRADEIYHDILKKLSAEFITPIDQEDVLRLTQILDDVTDALDEAVLDVYMYRIDVIPRRTPELSRIVNRCVKGLHEAIVELKNFKKPEKLRELLGRVNDIEMESDAAYAEAIYDLFGSATEGKILVGSKAIYESLENCCDLCERAADVIEQVVMKNT